MIKNILAPTDFSPNAHLAAQQAARLARYAGARLVLFHALHPLSPQDIPGESEVVVPEEIAQTSLDNLARELHTDYAISITRLLKPGSALEEIIRLAHALKVDLVAMGTQGASASSTKTMGLIARTSLLAPELPVVCIPAGADVCTPARLRHFLEEYQHLCTLAGLRVLSEFCTCLEKPDSGADASSSALIPPSAIL